jgi:hypothetical protein
MKCQICGKEIDGLAHRAGPIRVYVSLTSEQGWVWACWVCSLRKAWEASNDLEKSALLMDIFPWQEKGTG